MSRIRIEVVAPYCSPPIQSKGSSRAQNHQGAEGPGFESSGLGFKLGCGNQDSGFRLGDKTLDWGRFGVYDCHYPEKFCTVVLNCYPLNPKRLKP